MFHTKTIKTVNLILCALFAALTAVLSQAVVSIGPVPINLAHISVFVSAGLLGAKYGALSQAVFIVMGSVGLPVFSNFEAGINRISGPTGGYLIAYILCAFIIGFIAERFGKSVKILILAMYIGWIVTYTMGTLWYSYVTQTGFLSALMICVIPFLLGDAVKTAVSVVLIRKLSPFVKLNQKKDDNK